MCSCMIGTVGLAGLRLGTTADQLNTELATIPARHVELHQAVPPL